MIEQTLFHGPYVVGPTIAEYALTDQSVKRVEKKRAAREGRTWPKQNGPKRGRKTKAPKDRRRADLLVRQLYRIKGMVNEFGAIAVSIEAGAVRGSSNLDKYPGDLVGIYDRRAKLKDIEADVRAALAAK